MPRRRRTCPSGVAQHLIQRGNNRQLCFGYSEDFVGYAHLLCESAERFSVEIHAWVFMTKHVHLLATPREDDGISRMMQYLGRLYVRYFNHRYRRAYTLWEGRFIREMEARTETYLRPRRPDPRPANIETATNA